MNEFDAMIQGAVEGAKQSKPLTVADGIKLASMIEAIAASIALNVNSDEVILEMSGLQHEAQALVQALQRR